MTQHLYELGRVTKAEQLRGLLVGGMGLVSVVDGSPNDKAREAVEVLFEIVSDISDICEDFGILDWQKAENSIDMALSKLNLTGYYLYSALLEKLVVNPYNGVEESLPAMLLAVSEHRSPEILLDPKMVNDLPSV